MKKSSRLKNSTFFFCKNLSQNFYNIFHTDPLVEKQYFTRFFFISHKLKLVYVISRIDAVHQRRSRLREFSINNFSRDKRRKEGGEENNLGACQAKLHRQCSCALSMNIIFPIRVTFSPLIEINQKRDLDEFYSPSSLNRLFHFHWKIYIYISVSSHLRYAWCTVKIHAKWYCKKRRITRWKPTKRIKTCRFWNLRHSMRMTFFSSV